MARLTRPDHLKVLIQYTVRGASAPVSQAVYSGPSKKHADQAYAVALELARKGILVNCTIRFFDGYRLRPDFERAASELREVTTCE